LVGEIHEHGVVAGGVLGDSGRDWRLVWAVLF